MSYQKTAGTLSQGAHPGSYNGQDAYNDVLVTENDLYHGETRLSHEGAVEYGVRLDGNRLQRSTYNFEGGRESSMKSAVRRLLPIECERLQGFPDNWTLIGDPNGTKVWKDEDGNEYPYEDYVYTDSEGKRKSVSDASRYKALGNSICLPFWHWLMKRISAQYERPATLGSFFDGIGGFPLCHERINGPGTALFASEIDEFCIAVTKEHFGGEVVKDE